MNTNPAPFDSPDDKRPLVASVCGTFLKAEMQSIYRQITGLRRHRTVVFTEKIEKRRMFPFDPVVVMEKQVRPRLRGNFLLRFWYKYLIRQWPPPRPINRQVKPYHPYNLPDLLADWKVDLAHVYYGHKAVKYLPMIRAWGGPLVVSFHGVDVVKYVDEEGAGPEGATLAEVFEEAELVLARSCSLLDKLRNLGCPEAKLRLNRTPIPMDDLPWQVRRPPEDGAWRLVQACRLITKKGLFTALEALALVLPEFPNLRYVICGTGPMEGELRARIAAMGLGRNVELRGWLDQAALRSEYAAAHAFLHPSELTEEQDQEGVPNSMLEAMAMGLPVVATLHGGIPEAVEHESDGLLAPEKNPVELAGMIRRLLSAPDLLARLSQNAAMAVRTRYGLVGAVEALEDCYAEALNRHGMREKNSPRS